MLTKFEKIVYQKIMEEYLDQPQYSGEGVAEMSITYMYDGKKFQKILNAINALETKGLIKTHELDIEIEGNASWHEDYDPDEPTTKTVHTMGFIIPITEPVALVRKKQSKLSAR